MPRPSAAPRRRVTPPSAPGPLSDLTVPFVNPGALRMLTCVPDGLAAGAPLVVVLHGCTQNAAGYDAAAGWSRLAATEGFAVLFPEQVRANNPNGCFNWFEAADTRRGGGEPASIANAVAAMVKHYRLDPARVFVTGLSAGGAMANVMLATYPDVFAGGAIIAGLPFGAASGVGEAWAAMSQPTAATAVALGDKVRDASTFTGPWPVVSVWHGGDDRTVSVRNGAAVAAQWADVHGATSSDGTTWRNAAGVVVVEYHEIDGMGHGTPIDSGDGGVAAPFMLDVGIASSARIAAFWGVAAAGPSRTGRATTPASDGAPSRAAPTPTPTPARTDIAGLIGDALRAAGLMH